MATEICITIEVDGRPVTRCIPFAYDPNWRLKHPGNGDPDLHWKGEDIATLGAISELTESLRDAALKAKFTEIVRGAINEVNHTLPQGVQVRLEARSEHMEHAT